MELSSLTGYIGTVMPTRHHLGGPAAHHRILRKQSEESKVQHWPWEGFQEGFEGGGRRS